MQKRSEWEKSLGVPPYPPKLSTISTIDLTPLIVHRFDGHTQPSEKVQGLPAFGDNRLTHCQAKDHLTKGPDSDRMSELVTSPRLTAGTETLKTFSWIGYKQHRSL